MTEKRRLILIELNEVNFEVARHYVDRLKLDNFRRLFANGVRRTSSEGTYEQLEPWIQWVSAHSGQTAAEHGIFRLGDIVGQQVPQFFEQLESRGLRVGAVSPMNAENRLKRPAYFVPDPWTKTPSDPSLWSRLLTRAVSQAVNDNSEGRITLLNALALGAGLLRFARPKNYRRYADLARRSRGAPWRKALFLDLFLNDLHLGLLDKHRPDFSTLFLNAGAHIQHHYFLNSPHVATDGPRNPGWYVAASEDPLAEMFQVYDGILGEYLDRRDTSLLIATGLTQVPYPYVTFYYRPKAHETLLRQLGLSPKAVHPRMTRDFLVEFEDDAQALAAERLLRGLTSSTDGVALFEEVDNRGASLYVTLTYPNEVTPSTTVLGCANPLKLQDHVVFVAVKNGMHDANGFICCHGDMARFAPTDGAHVKSLHTAVLDFFA